MWKYNLLKARIRQLCYLGKLRAESYTSELAWRKEWWVWLTSESLIDVDGAEYSIRRPTRRQ